MIVENLSKSYVTYEGFFPSYAPNQYFSWIVNLIALARRRKKVTKVLESISFKCGRGEILGIVGPNGSGKTTLLRCISGILKPDTGKIFLNGLDVIRDFERIRGKIVYISTVQWRSYEWELTCYDNLMFLAKLMNFRGKEAKEKVLEALKKFGLLKYRDYPPRKLSTGLRQRLVLARLTFTDPDLLLLDEPTLGLDIDSSKMFRSYVKELVKRGNKILFLKKGKAVYYGKLDEVKRVLENKVVLEVDLKVTNYAGLAELKEKFRVYYDLSHLSTGVCNLKFILDDESELKELSKALNRIGEVFFQEIREPGLEEVYYYVYGKL